MQTEIRQAAPRKTRGEIFEGIAFTFCKATTAALVVTLVASERYVLPVIALATALYYALAWLSGKRDTRCLMRFPLLIVLVYGALGVWGLWLAAQGKGIPSLWGAP